MKNLIQKNLLKRNQRLLVITLVILVVGKEFICEKLLECVVIIYFPISIEGGELIRKYNKFLNGDWERL